MDNVKLGINKISKRFPGVQALKEANFTLRRGEVHALIGENGAGKSTLMNIILGTYQPSSGTMVLDGKDYAPRGPQDALRNGIAMIHQEISLVSDMSVFENVWLGNEKHFGSNIFSKKKKMIEATKYILEDLNLDIDPEIEVGKLTISRMQLVEIARAISWDSDIIIMDEPSSSLTDAELEKLFSIIAELKAKGKSVIYISHKLDEIFVACDRVTVFRDGQFIAEKDTTGVTKQELVNLMVGRELSDMYPKTDIRQGETILEIKNFSREGKFENVNFTVHSGEILGFCGLVGAGRTEIMQSLFGLDIKNSGEVFLKGRKIIIKSAHDAIRNGLAMVTEDRRGSGIIPGLSVKINITIAYLNKLSRFGFINKRSEDNAYSKIIESMAIKTASNETVVSMLSGGNQQKVIIGKWLLTGADVLILDEPTRGIDVGAKSEIYRLMGSLAAQGKAVIMVSSELPELFGICDRILVIHQGRIADEFTRQDFNQEKVMQSAFGLKQQGVPLNG
jgi:ABC-type sugar transport system ATPase subunit